MSEPTEKQRRRRQESVADQLWAEARTHVYELSRIGLEGSNGSEKDAQLMQIACSLVATELLIRKQQHEEVEAT